MKITQDRKLTKDTQNEYSEEEEVYYTRLAITHVYTCYTHRI